MDILVCVKSVLDYEAPIRLLENQCGVDSRLMKSVINPYDEIAVEEAVRLKESGHAHEVVAVTIGPKKAQSQLRHAMAMGVDRGILVVCEGYVDSDLAARALAVVCAQEACDLILMGKQAVDSNANQTGQLLAAKLNIPQACFASKIDVNRGFAIVEREVDGGVETVKVTLPAVITADLKLNSPRRPDLGSIIKAKKRLLKIVGIDDLGIDIKAKTKIIRMIPPSWQRRGQQLQSVQELVNVLRQEANVI